MKVLNSSASKSGASSSQKLNGPPHCHEDHVLLLDSLTASLKDELKRGLNIVDSVVNQLAQAKWVILNVDKTLEELYENCPACDINATKKSNTPAVGASRGGGGGGTKVRTLKKVLPMVSGYTFQRPNITVTRVEQERRHESSSRSRANPVLPAPTVQPASSTATAHSSSNPPVARAQAATRRSAPKKKPAPRRRPPPKKPSANARASSSSSQPQPSGKTAVVTTSSRGSGAADGTSVNRSHAGEGAATAAPKRPGPRSRTLFHDADLPILTREGAVSGDDLGVAPTGEETQGSASGSSVAKSPPTLVPYNADNRLKITSFSLTRDGGPVTYVTSQSGASAVGSKQKTESCKAIPSTSNMVTSSGSTVSATSSKRHSASSDPPAFENVEIVEKKQKLETSNSTPPEKKDDQPSMADLLQLKFQKYREQQRKKELQRKAAEAKADAGEVEILEMPSRDSEHTDTNSPKDVTGYGTKPQDTATETKELPGAGGSGAIREELMETKATEDNIPEQLGTEVEFTENSNAPPEDENETSRANDLRNPSGATPE